jgi:hypothetical protein
MTAGADSEFGRRRRAGSAGKGAFSRFADGMSTSCRTPDICWEVRSQNDRRRPDKWTTEGATRPDWDPTTQPPACIPSGFGSDHCIRMSGQKSGFSVYFWLLPGEELLQCNCWSLYFSSATSMAPFCAAIALKSLISRAETSTS